MWYSIPPRMNKTYNSIVARDDFNTNVSALNNFDIFTQAVYREDNIDPTLDNLYHCAGQTFPNDSGGVVTCTENGTSNASLNGYVYKDFIFPFRYSYKTVIDGIADGLTTFEVWVDGGSDYTVDYYITPYIYLMARDSSGNDRILASTSMKQKSGTRWTTTGETLTSGVLYIPYYVEIDNQTIDYDEKLILRTYFTIDSGTKLYYLTSGAVSTVFHLKIYTTLNTDDFYINLPVVA